MNPKKTDLYITTTTSNWGKWPKRMRVFSPSAVYYRKTIELQIYEEATKGVIANTQRALFTVPP